MAFSTTTEEVIENNAKLRYYETLEIKRRYPDGYEASWYDVSSYLLSKNASKVSLKLDFNSFAYGQFKAGTAKFQLDNSSGLFNNENDIYSLFATAISRHYTKIRYSAGYYDEDGAKINEVVFEGLLNGKTIKNDFKSGKMTFNTIDYAQILAERTISEGTITSSVASNVIGDIFNADSTITDYITFNAGNINPGNDITFDDATKFEKKKITIVLNDIAKKTNSVWYVNSSLAIIFKSRAINANTPFEFIGGARQARNVNILDVEFFDDGFTKIINQVKYTSGSSVTLVSSQSKNLEQYGTNQLQLSGEDLTTSATILSVCNDIIDELEIPKRRVIVTTVYMPNVIDLLDKCTIDYKPKTYNFGRQQLIFNASTYFNDGYYFGRYINRNIIVPADVFKYVGYEHNIAKGVTKHYLIEN
jgi:hypothetical protein